MLLTWLLRSWSPRSHLHATARGGPALIRDYPVRQLPRACSPNYLLARYVLPLCAGGGQPLGKRPPHQTRHYISNRSLQASASLIQYGMSLNGGRVSNEV